MLPTSVSRLVLDQDKLGFGIIMLHDAFLALLSCVDNYKLDLPSSPGRVGPWVSC
jgi:hypothetical protein